MKNSMVFFLFRLLVLLSLATRSSEINVPTQEDDLINNLLYKTISYSGIEDRSIILDLVNRGANPQAINIEGRTLVHLAVKKCDPELLRFLVEELQVPIPDASSNRSILIEALDSNPFPQRPKNRFWETINYLVKKGALHVPKPEHPQLIHSGTIHTTDQFSSFYETFAASHSISDFESVQYPPEVQNYRRNLILQDCYRQLKMPKLAISTRAPDSTTLTEVLLKYQGSYDLSPEEATYFRHTVETALKHDTIKEPLSPHQFERIKQAISSNINTINDIEFVEKLLHESILPNLCQIERRAIIKAICMQVSKKNHLSFLKNTSLREEMQNFTTLHEITRNIPILKVHSELQHILQTSQRRNYINGLICIFKDKQTNFECQISNADVEQFTEVSDSDNKMTEAINTEQFLQMIQDAEVENNLIRSSQLIDVGQVMMEKQNRSVIGNYVNLFFDVIKNRSLTKYYIVRRIMKYFSQKMKDLKSFFIKSIQPHAFNISTIIHFLPSIKAAAKVFDLCVIKPRNCSNYVSMLGATVGLFIGRKAVELPILYFSFVGLKEQINELKLTKEIPAVAKMRKSLKIRRHLRQMPIKLAFAILGLAIDIWNIIDLYSKLQTCLDPSSRCSDQLLLAIKVKIAMGYIKMIESIITSCLMLNIITSLSIWAVVFAIDRVVIPLAILIYFLASYSLSFKEVLQAFTSLWTPESYKDSVERAGLAIEFASYTATKLLEENPMVIAVAIAIGKIVDKKNERVIQSPCTVNMTYPDPKNTLNLARVIPKESSGFIRLCLPHDDRPKQLNGGISADPVPSAVYYCEGAIVLGHEERWNVIKNGYIIYLLDNANSADVYGNDQHSNQFIIKNLTDPSKIVGGQFSNYYFIIYARNTSIYLNPMAEKEIIDFSESQTWVTRFQFYYKNSEIIGTLSFDYGWPCEIYWQHPNIDITTKKKNNEHLLRTKQILGRTRKPDEIQCLDSSAMYKKIIKTHVIFADGRGGRSPTEMDIIKNCQQTVLQPFSKYILTLENVFGFYAHIDKSTAIPGRAKTYSMIEIQKGQVAMTFRGSALTRNTISMKYKPWTNVLTWELVWSNGTIMVLDIKGFYRDLTDDHDNQTTSAVQIQDEYSGGVFFPVINFPEDITNTTIIDVQQFLVGTTSAATGAQFADAFNNYRLITALKNPTFDLGILVTFNSTSQTYFFGKNDSDTIYLEPNTRYAAGLNGVDYYSLLALSPEYTVINNEASDDAIDYFVVPKGICDALNIRRHDLHLPLIQPGDNDIIITCTSRNSSRRINVILENYLLDKIYQHLCILWNNTPYVIIPKHWNLTLNDDSDSNRFEIIQFYSLKNVDKPVIINVNSTGASVIYVSDKYQPFEAHVGDDEQSNVLLTLKNMSSVTLNLQDFYIIEDGHEIISPKWINKLFIIADDFSEGSLVSEIDAIEINRLVDLSRLETIKLGEKFEKSMHRLHDNNSTNITIDYAHEFTSNHDDVPRTLELNRIQPDETYAGWNSEREALAICTKYSCANIVNWCKSVNYRLQLIHFNILTSRTPIIIEDLDELECKGPYNDNQDNIVKVLNFKLVEAQRLLSLMENSFSDTAIFRTCIGIFYAENVTSLPIYRLFSFLNEYEQSAFAWKYCSKVITPEKIINLTQNEVQDIIEYYIAHYKIKRNLSSNTNWPDERKIFSLLRKSFNRHISDDWNNFLSHIYKILFPTEFQINFKHNTDIENGHLLHLGWYEQSIRYFQKCK